MTKLNDFQTILLSSAAQRQDGNLLPPPKTIGADADRIGKAIAALIKRGYAIEAVNAKPDQVWRIDAGLRFGAVITDAGRIAIGIEPESSEPDLAAAGQADGTISSNATRLKKAALVLSLLQRQQGATLAELIEATRWLPHTTRAALTRIRNKGHAVSKDKRDDVTYYSMTA